MMISKLRLIKDWSRLPRETLSDYKRETIFQFTENKRVHYNYKKENGIQTK